MTRALAVVAHFDDAVIWAGGAIRRSQALGWSWTILCACAAEESRRQYFLESCAALGARGVALEFVDHPDGVPFSRNGRDALCRAVRDATGEAPMEWIFTHSLSPEGEYGPHPNHTEAARAAASLVERGIVLPARLVQFCYRRTTAGEGVAPAAGIGASHVLQLDYDDLAWKAEWCARARDVELRDPALGGVSWLERLGWPCPNPEAFEGHGLTLPPPFAQR